MMLFGYVCHIVNFSYIYNVYRIMGFVESLLEGIFGINKKDNHLKQEIAVNSNLTRSLQFKKGFTSFLQHKSYLNFTKEFNQKMKKGLIGIQDNSDFFVFNQRASMGFYFTCSEGVELHIYQFLLDFFKSKTLDLGYKLYTSDIRTKEKGDNIETIERHYFKPPMTDLSQKKINQVFGNILMELVLINDKASYLKIMAHAYSDHLYNAPKRQQDYFEHILPTT